MTTQIADVYEFGGCRLDVPRRILTRDGAALPLAPKTFELLLLLLQSQGRALSKQELMSALWPDVFVEEANLSFQIAALRKALGNGASQWVETIPKHGYRFAGKVKAFSTEAADAATASTAVAESPRIAATTRGSYRWRWIAGIVALLALLTTVAVAFLNRPTAEVKSAATRVPVAVPLTTDPGYETTPSFSPDGSQVAFAWSKQSKPDYDIYVKLVGPGEPIPLTTDPAHDLNPAWSPKGGLIAFERSTTFGKADLYVVPALGGAAERMIAHDVGVGLNSSIAWTPDGKWLAHWADGPQSGIWLFGVDNSAKRQVTRDGHGPSFSEDGRRMAYIRNVGTGVALYVQPLTAELTAEGPPIRVTPEVSFLRPAAWTPKGDSLVYTAAGWFGVGRLYKVRLTANRLDSAGPPELLPFGENADSLALSSQTGGLVYSAYTRDTTLLRLDLRSRDQAPTPLALSTYDEYTPDYSPDGERIAFTSTRTGEEEIWIADAAGIKPVQRTWMRGPVCSNPRWSPDGSKIMFHSAGRATARALYLLNPATGRIDPVDDGAEYETEASWSRDGKTIYFMSRSTPGAETQIWKMPAGGGSREPVTRGGGAFAIESVDRRYLYYAKVVNGTSIWRVPVNGGEEIPVVGDLLNPLSFAVARDGLYFMTGSLAGGRPGSEAVSRKNTIEFFDFKTGHSKTIIELDKSAWIGLAVSPDERYLLYSVINNISRNLMFVDKVE
jgi:Tol biopolymer transport system component/DNA-binding winged helix-turn-helix (wHTH) protein